MTELLLLFLRLGCIGFGGPQAHIAMMEDECVRKRGWLSPERFAQGLALCNLLPGPASTQLAIWIGYERRRWAGAIGSGVVFILPAFLMVVALAALYVRFGGFSITQGFLLGVKPAVVGIVLATCRRLWQPLAKNRRAPYFLIASLLLTLAFPAWVALVLVAAGVSGIAMAGRPAKPAAAVHLWPLFLYFFKTGSLIFGGGLVLIPLLHGDVVTHNRWLGDRQFLDAVAIGQVTPGPVVITSAFIGYLLVGFPGAVVAAAGMFLPSFLMILGAAPFLERVHDNAWTKAALQGLMPAVVGAILAATITLAGACLVHGSAGRALQVLIAAASLTAAVRYKVNAGAIVVVAGILGAVVGWGIHSTFADN